MVSTSPEPPRLNGPPCESEQPSENQTSSDSEDEQPALYEGYELLPQQFEDEESILNGNDPNNVDELSSNAEGNQQSFVCNFAPHDIPMDAEKEERVQLWSGPGGRDVEMNAERTHEVMQAMAGFTLPSTAVPAWASCVPEDQWRAKLEERLQTMNMSQGKIFKDIPDH